MAQDAKFCHKCGSPLAQGAAFCSKCGSPVVAPSAPPTGAPGPSATPPSAPPAWERRRERHEKHEKGEKQEKNEKQEKGRGGDLAGAMTGGLILILLGVLFYLSQTGAVSVTWANWWEYFLIGVGGILILQGIVRSIQRGHWRPGSFIGGIVLLIIGVSFVSTSDFALWPLLLVVLGLAAIASAVVGRRRTPPP